MLFNRLRQLSDRILFLKMCLLGDEEEKVRYPGVVFSVLHHLCCEELCARQSPRVTDASKAPFAQNQESVGRSAENSFFSVIRPTWISTPSMKARRGGRRDGWGVGAVPVGLWWKPLSCFWSGVWVGLDLRGSAKPALRRRLTLPAVLISHLLRLWGVLSVRRHVWTVRAGKRLHPVVLNGSHLTAALQPRRWSAAAASQKTQTAGKTCSSLEIERSGKSSYN